MSGFLVMACWLRLGLIHTPFYHNDGVVQLVIDDYGNHHSGGT